MIREEWGRGIGGEITAKKKKEINAKINAKKKRLEGFWAEPFYLCTFLLPVTKYAKHQISDHQCTSIFPGRSISILPFTCCSFIPMITPLFYHDYWKWQNYAIFFSYVAWKGIDSKGNILNKSSDIKSNTYFCFADGEDTRWS